MAYEPMIHLYQTKLQQATDEAILDSILREVLKTGVMVDRAELMKALQYDRGQYEKGYADGRNDAAKWTAFSETTPPVHEHVLCLGTDEGKSYIYIDFALSDGEMPYTSLYNPTHWMPLPEPPREDDHATD